MKKLFFYVLFFSLLTSCVSTKQMTNFKGEPIKRSDIYKLNNEPYRLQVNDILYIDIKATNPEIVAVFKSSEGASSDFYFSGYTVDRHGNIRIPYIGDVNVLGYTEKEIQDKLELELGKYFKNPDLIFVTVKLAGIQFIVSGEVGSPGTVNLKQNQVTIVDAIANAGEITQYGNRSDITIIRNSLDGVKKYKLDITKIDVFESENFYIQPNDIIYVPPLKQKALGIGTTAMQTFSTIVTLMSFIVSSVLLVKNI